MFTNCEPVVLTKSEIGSAHDATAIEIAIVIVDVFVVVVRITAIAMELVIAIDIDICVASILLLLFRLLLPLWHAFRSVREWALWALRPSERTSPAIRPVQSKLSIEKHQVIRRIWICSTMEF